NFADLVYPKALEELHDQYARRRDLSINAGDDHKVTVAEQLSEALDVIGLVVKIHFFGDDAGKLVDDRPRGSNDVVIDELLENEDQVLDNTNVRRHEFFDPGPKDFHDDFFAAIPCAMYLSERGGCKRLSLEGIAN